MLQAHQKDILALWYIVNMSLSGFYKLVQAFGSAQNALQQAKQNPESWQKLSIHKSHIARLLDVSSTQAFLYRIQEQYDKGLFGLIFLGDTQYPDMLGLLYDPPPVLFVRGNMQRLTQMQLAIVGSRNPSDYAQKVTFDLAQYLVQAGFVITSGLALGVDACAHKGALAQSDHTLSGQTIGVMGTGIDVCYPPQNQGLVHAIVQEGGCLLSEFLPTTPASKHTFPRRNRIITSLALATIITEAAKQSGSLISARLASEQGKQVFVLPHRIDNLNAEGCHYLIREGATLFYHPNQIIEELRPQTSIAPRHATDYTAFQNTDNHTPSSIAHNTQNPAPTVPAHLQVLYDLLLDTPRDLDFLVYQSKMGTGEILAQLTELEIAGLVVQKGGYYGVC